MDQGAEVNRIIFNVKCQAPATDHALRLSVFQHLYATAPIEVETLTAAHLAERLTRLTIAPFKEDVQLWAPVSLAPHCRRLARNGECFIGESRRPCTGGVHRLAENADLVHALVVEIDKTTRDAFWDANRPIHGAARVLYTTHSSGKAGPDDLSLRIVYPYARPVTRDEHSALWPRLVEVLGLRELADPSGSDACRLYYFHSCPPDRRDDAWASAVPGKPLDPDVYLNGIDVRRRERPRDATAAEVAALGLECWTVEQAREFLATAVPSTKNDLHLALPAVLKGEAFAWKGQPGAAQAREPTLKALADDISHRCGGRLDADTFLDLIASSLAETRRLCTDHGPDYDGLSDEHALKLYREARDRYMAAAVPLRGMENAFDDVLAERDRARGCAHV